MDLTTEWSISESNYTNHTASNTQTFNLFSFYAFLYTPSIFVNSYVIYVALSQLKNSHHQKRVTLLIAHLSFVSICGILSHLFNTSNTSRFISPHNILCGWFAYWKSVFTCAFSLNSTFIVHEQINSMKQTNKNKGSVAGVVATIWLISMIFNIPTALMTISAETFEDSMGTCIAVNLMDSSTATLIYEILRFALYSGIGTPYIVYAWVKVRTILKILQEESNTANERLNQPLRSMRVIYFHLATMAVLWIPGGLVILAQRTFGRLNIAESLENWPTPLILVFKGVVILVALFTFANPFISLYLLGSKPTQFKFGVCCKDFTGNSANNDDIPLADLNSIGNTRDIKLVNCSESASRFATIVAVSAEQNCDNKSAKIDTKSAVAV